MPTTKFDADAVLFDMDGTLTDSIAAVEAAWHKVASEIGMDPAMVIAATHGKRACDNLASLKPHLRAHEIPTAVIEFEESILFFADAHRRRAMSMPTSARPQVTAIVQPLSPDSIASTPYDSAYDSEASSEPSSAGVTLPRQGHAASFCVPERPSFATRLSQALIASILDGSAIAEDDSVVEKLRSPFTTSEFTEPWQIEAAEVDRAVRILPGVRRMLNSIPEGRYAVATSGAKTYAHGCLTRVGIVPPAITITADDPRLTAGKPDPAPFLLAAQCLGHDSRRCVVFEDSPAGIRAGVAAGSTVIAVCTSHPREKIEGCGAHFIVETMEQVRCKPVVRDGQECLEFTVELDG